MRQQKLLTGQCRTCGETIKIAMDDATKEHIIEVIAKWDTFSCPGHHVELSGPYPHHWALDDWVIVEGQVPSEEEFEAQLRADHKEVRDTEGMAGLITSFSLGFPMTNDGRSWDFTVSPEGKRWYYTDDE